MGAAIAFGISDDRDAVQQRVPRITVSYEQVVCAGRKGDFETLLLCHSLGSGYEKPKKSFLYVFCAKLPLSGFRVVLLLVVSWQLTRGVAAHSNTSNDSVFMAVQLTRVPNVSLHG